MRGGEDSEICLFIDGKRLINISREPIQPYEVVPVSKEYVSRIISTTELSDDNLYRINMFINKNVAYIVASGINGWVFENLEDALSLVKLIVGFKAEGLDKFKIEENRDYNDQK